MDEVSFKLSFLLSLVAFIGVYWFLYGLKFGLGFVALIFLHEMGHFIDIKRRGLPAEVPVYRETRQKYQALQADFAGTCPDFLYGEPVPILFLPG